MTSSGTGADITAAEANDLLHKLITESTKVQAMLACDGSLFAIMVGILRVAPDGTLRVVESEPSPTTQMSFNPSLAVVRKYADNRAFPTARLASVEGGLSLAAALTFVFPNGAQVALFEIAER